MKIVDARTNARAVREVTERRTEPDPVIEARAREILERVRREGDEAVTTLTRQLDCRFIDSLGLRVSEKEITGAYAQVDPAVLHALRLARANITRFHRRQVPRSWEIRQGGSRLGQRFSPLDRVGIYIPGGKAAYPSTVLMNAVPARIAGVKEIVMATPCSQEGKIAPEVLVAGAECGITEIYRMGGAQAIAALAYGTESIPRVEKITGPGNAYVAAAKKLVFGAVGIDMIAGPTEVVIVADATARPELIAADLIAQAEHDELATPLVVLLEDTLVAGIEREVADQLARAPRQSIARKALEGQGLIILAGDRDQAAAIVNLIAPEHLELMLARPRPFAAKIRNAGSIFIGRWSTEAMGDYAAGPNHTLPTSGSARFSSPLGVADFTKFTNVIELNEKAFRRLAPTVETLARAEGLYGHGASVSIRRGKKP
jgi:histidinol dehydrogenase